MFKIHINDIMLNVIISYFVIIYLRVYLRISLVWYSFVTTVELNTFLRNLIYE